MKNEIKFSWNDIEMYWIRGTFIKAEQTDLKIRIEARLQKNMYIRGVNQNLKKSNSSSITA